MTDELQAVVGDLTATAQAVMAELERLSEIADSQRQAGDVAALVETQATIIKLDTELLCCAQRMGEMQHEALLRTESERDALLAEVARLRAALPTWRNHSSDGVYLWLTTRKGHFRGSVEARHGWYMAEVGPAREGGLVPHRFAELADAKRFVEQHHGLPECEVVE